MHEHNKSFHIRLTEKEYQLLCKRAKQSGLFKSTYIRFMIEGCCPKERPDDRFYVVMRQLAGMSSNCNQLARKANALGFIDAPMYKQEAEQWAKFRKDMVDRYLMPEPVDIPATLERGRFISETGRREGDGE